MSPEHVNRLLMAAGDPEASEHDQRKAFSFGSIITLIELATKDAPLVVSALQSAGTALAPVIAGIVAAATTPSPVSFFALIQLLATNSGLIITTLKGADAQLKPLIDAMIAAFGSPAPTPAK